MECDFCSDKNVVRRFQCMDFEAESKDAGVRYTTPRGKVNLILHSINYWAACKTCAELVEAEDLDGLLAHSIVMFQARGYRVSVDTARHMQHTYELFFRNRIRVEEPDAEGESS